MRSLMQDEETFEVTETELGVEGAQPDVTYRLRMVPLEQMKALQRKNTAKLKSPRTGLLTSGDTDLIGFGFDCFDYCVVGWTGIVAHGQPAPCTRENKLLLAKNLDLVGAISRRCGYGQTADELGDGEGTGDSFRRPA